MAKTKKTQSKTKKPTKMSRAEFLDFCENWYAENYDLKLPKKSGYDAWLNYFKTRTPAEIKDLAKNGQYFLTVEAFSALSRWHDIIKNPHKIDKIYQAGLEDKKPQNNTPNILALAQKNDRLGVLCALRDEIAEKISKGTGTRDLASLTRELGDILDQISEIERKKGVAKNTKLAELVDDQDFTAKPTPKRTRGEGMRGTSITARLTIDDIEG